MKNSDILIAARAKIEKPEHWTQGAFARDGDGAKLQEGYNKEAVCYCSLGAVESVVHVDNYHTPATEYLQIVAWKEFSMGVPDYNDGHTHQDILSMFDKAILLAKAEEELRE